jgi:PhnB protein
MNTEHEGRGYVPPGGQVLTTYICPRDAAAAIDWYKEVFGAVETYDRFVDPAGRVGHAEISIDGAPIMLSDAYPDYGGVAPEPGSVTATFALNLYVRDADATIAAAEKAGATIQRPVEDQVYGSRMGTMMDPFGVRWMVSTHIRDVSQEEIAKAVSDFSETGADTGPVE